MQDNKSHIEHISADGTEHINVYGARSHNLKNIDISIPRNKLTVITGLSGSGKSSLAFDTIFAEGQRRYIETFSAYARSFLGNLERPDVDKITGLSPVISIEQKTTSKNPRSTVGTTTELYDFIRLLYARAGEAYSYVTGEKMVKYSDDKIINLITENYSGKRISILAPLVKGRKGHYKELFENIIRKGYLYVRIDGEVKEVSHGMRVDRYKIHDIEVVIDRLQVGEKEDKRLRESVKLAMQIGKGNCMILEKDSNAVRYFSRHLMCPTSGISYDEPAPHSFSFNSPHGACPRCKGLGTVNQIDYSRIIPDKNISIHAGGIVPLGKYRNSIVFWQLEAIGEKYGFTLKTPLKNVPEEALDEIFNGSDQPIRLKNTPLGMSSSYSVNFDGITKYIEAQQDSKTSKKAQKWADQFIKTVDCDVCHGGRLKQESLWFRIHDRNIAEVSNMDVRQLAEWFDHLEPHLSDRQKAIASEILKEIRTRIRFLLDVGLDYLSLNRSSMSLSGGESQRIRLATQIGSQLVNVLYILDEPSIGLHPRDNRKLIQSLSDLRDTGNSVIVVEHDKEMMLSADYIVDLGPHAGRHGGEIVAYGTPQDILKSKTLTAAYLTNEKKIEVPSKRRDGNGKQIIVTGAEGHNLKKVDVAFPLGKLICVTGVSGSGKSTLVNETLHPALSQLFYKSVKDPLKHKKITGTEHIDKVVDVDQSPIGRTPRSNPATYTGLFGDIRNVFQELPESKIRGYKAGRFSFNVAGGRCETCGGNGYKTIEMNFLPDVLVPCEDCHGKRYNNETLEVRYKGKSISDVLDMTINQAVEFFESIPKIQHKLSVLQKVGLGYLTLGQPSTTLSGGEAQRVKLATELAKKDTGKTMYILDEPTTGLHFEDIRVLLKVLNLLVDKGNTVIVIEHNMDVIKAADYIIDIGPEGGNAGGKVICTGTPEEVAQHKKSYTAKFIRDELNRHQVSK
ncbi:excinuclease ABC subunit UvrA [Saccharicrinis sp. FJH62]|uniref:excinuclease ABC subunit UvrA n=1 Tax=Saccharicrinis sp. FJH62 TaxID=3344657 RepID=UPI0035D3F080